MPLGATEILTQVIIPSLLIELKFLNAKEALSPLSFS
jgi:hypothetical protein